MASPSLVVTTTSSQASSSPGPGLTSIDNVGEVGGESVVSGSPPLIVAFLAIGVFTVAVTIAFCWRRMRDTRLVVHVVGRPVRSSRKPVGIGERPILWDIWTQNGDKCSAASQVSIWENITPFSAGRSRSTYPLLPLPVTTAVTMQDWNSPSVPVSPQPTLSAVRRFHPTAPPPRLAQLSEVQNQTDGWHLSSSTEGTLAKGSPLQIAVIIAMPTLSIPQRATSTSLEGMLGGLDGELADFCIGTAEVPVKDG
ncbi:hypothetical protein J3A83DRAFT_1124631 [Scleroderma citrinum]